MDRWLGPVLCSKRSTSSRTCLVRWLLASLWICAERSRCTCSAVPPSSVEVRAAVRLACGLLLTRQSRPSSSRETTCGVRACVRVLGGGRDGWNVCEMRTPRGRSDPLQHARPSLCTLATCLYVLLPFKARPACMRSSYFRRRTPSRSRSLSHKPVRRSETGGVPLRWGRDRVCLRLDLHGACRAASRERDRERRTWQCGRGCGDHLWRRARRTWTGAEQCRTDVGTANVSWLGLEHGGRGRTMHTHMSTSGIERGSVFDSAGSRAGWTVERRGGSDEPRTGGG